MRSRRNHRTLPAALSLVLTTLTGGTAHAQARRPARDPNAQGDPSQAPAIGRAAPTPAATPSAAPPAASSAAPAAAPSAAPPPAPQRPNEPSSPAQDAQNPAQCEGPRIERVAFDGAVRVSPGDISGSLRAREGRCFDRASLTRDAHSLWDLGFFQDVQVAAQPLENGNVEVRFALTERPSIHAVRVEGNDAVEEDKIREQLELREGAVLSDTAVRRTVQKIRDLYAEKGYFLAEVRADVVRREDNEVDVVIRIREGAQVQVRSISFVGNDHIDAGDLRSVMQTSVGGFFSFLTSSGTYREETFRNDIDLLHAAYYDRGYLNVEIDNPRVALSPDRGFLDITIYVREGPRYRVGQFRVVELDDDDNEVEPLGGRRRVREIFHVQPGDWFARSTIGRDILSLQTHYRDAGHASVEVTPDIQPQREGSVVNLAVRVRRGPLTTVDRIVIRGNTKTADRIIRREMTLMEGDRYSESRYQESRRRVMQLGYFERVDLSTEPVEGHPERIIVNVEVTERPTGTFQVGAGVSSVETFIVTAQVQQLNLFGRGQSFTLQAQVSPLRQIFSARFVEPYLFDSNWTGALDVYNTLRAYANFSRTSTGGSLSLGYPLVGVNDLRLAVSYTGEQVLVNRGGGAALLSGVQAGAVTSLNSAVLANIFRNGFTSAIGLSLTADTRDNRLFPTSGIYARAGVEVADNYTGSQYQYVRWSGFFRFFAPLPLGIVLRGNITGGLITSRDPQGVPITERYFLGGVFDVRGYRLRTISPQISIPATLDPNGQPINYPIGGNAQAYYNLEIEIPIVQSLGLKAVLFHDAGNAFNLEGQFCLPGGTNVEVLSPCGVSSPFALRYSVGFGFRWFSPLGLLRFEWGFPINKLPNEEPSVFEFTIGNNF